VKTPEDDARESKPLVELVFHLTPGSSESLEQLERAVIVLRRELRDLGELRWQETVDAPVGTRSAGTMEMGAIGIALAPVFPSMVAALKVVLDWARKAPDRTISVERPDGNKWTVTGLSTSQLSMLITEQILREKRDDNAVDFE
jgi:hypothetical protein